MGLPLVTVEYSDEFAARLSLALQACNLSRAQLSAQLGVHKSMVSRWLSGEMKPSGYNLARLSAAIAGLKPGFNMSLWTAPRHEFEAVLGIPSRQPSPTTAESPAGEPGDLEAPPPAADLTRRRRWPVYAAVGAGLMLLAVALGALWLDGQRTRESAATGGLSPSLAVMPFVNMSGDPSKEYLGDGIAEEILNNLANTPALRVAARTSSFSFKGKHADIGEIAGKLHVRTVLEGSVRQEGNRLRIVAQLIDASNGFHLWSARYDRKLDDVLAVEGEIEIGRAHV